MNQPSPALLLKLAEELYAECLKVQGSMHLCLDHDTFAQKARQALGLTRKSTRVIDATISKRLTFRQVKAEANKRGLIFESNRETIEGETYRYEITDNASGMSAPVRDLDEAWSEIYHWHPKS